MALKVPSDRLYTRIFNLFVEVLAHTSIYAHCQIPIVKKFYGSRWVGGRDEEIFNYDTIQIGDFNVTVNTTTIGLEPSLICYGIKQIFCNIPAGCNVYTLSKILKKLISIIAPNENSDSVSAFGIISSYLIAKLINSVEEGTITGESIIDESPVYIELTSDWGNVQGRLSEDKAEYLRNLKDQDINTTAFSSLVSKLFDNYEIFSWLEFPFPDGESFKANLIY